MCNMLIISGAGEGNRTLVSGLGSPHSTIEPHPRPYDWTFLYQFPRGRATGHCGTIFFFGEAVVADFQPAVRVGEA